MPHLRALLAAGDSASARLVVHSLKGSSATLGMSALRHSAAALESALIDGSDANTLQTRVNEVEARLAKVMSTLRSTLAEPDT